MPIASRPRSLPGEMNPAEMIAARITDRQAREMETMALMENRLEMQKIKHSPQAQENAME